MKGCSSTSSRTLMDLFKQPAAKRLKSLSSPTLSPPSSSSKDASSLSASTLTSEERLKIEFKKALAKSKRNLKRCSDIVSKYTSEGIDGVENVKLKELLVEETWLEVLPGELEKPYAEKLCKFVESEICCGSVPIYPPQNLIFNALNTTSFDRVKVVIIGQDPYHGPGQAMGLSFSVPNGVKVPSSLVNIYKELQQDLGYSIPFSGNLEKWAIQGVLLLNAVLTGNIRQIHMQKKDGNYSLMLSLKQFHRRKEELFFFFGETMPRQKLGWSMRQSTMFSKQHILLVYLQTGASLGAGIFLVQTRSWRKWGTLL